MHDKNLLVVDQDARSFNDAEDEAYRATCVATFASLVNAALQDYSLRAEDRDLLYKSLNRLMERSRYAK